MSKTDRRHRNKGYDNYGYEDDYHGGRDQLHKHRVDKKIKNAIRSKDIDSLLELDDDDDYFE